MREVDDELEASMHVEDSVPNINVKSFEIGSF